MEPSRVKKATVRVLVINLCFWLAATLFNLLLQDQNGVAMSFVFAIVFSALFGGIFAISDLFHKIGPDTLRGVFYASLAGLLSTFLALLFSMQAFQFRPGMLTGSPRPASEAILVGLATYGLSLVVFAFVSSFREVEKVATRSANAMERIMQVSIAHEAFPRIGTVLNPAVFFDGEDAFVCYRTSERAEAGNVVLKFGDVIDFRMNPETVEGLKTFRYPVAPWAFNEVVGAEETTRWQVLDPRFWVISFNDVTLEIVFETVSLIHHGEERCPPGTTLLKVLGGS
ncbi:hypothetical protein ACHMW4_20645 [Mesorhizobium sp. UC22_110]|uniref:hypothetical protein n=1 Tax=unclassified Mesorhizobium TaxID=325217 RepID=UPI00366D8CE3